MLIRFFILSAAIFFSFGVSGEVDISLRISDQEKIQLADEIVEGVVVGIDSISSGGCFDGVYRLLITNHLKGTLKVGAEISVAYYRDLASMAVGDKHFLSLDKFNEDINCAGDIVYLSKNLKNKNVWVAGDVFNILKNCNGQEKKFEIAVCSGVTRIFEKSSDIYNKIDRSTKKFDCPIYIGDFGALLTEYLTTIKSLSLE